MNSEPRRLHHDEAVYSFSLRLQMGSEELDALLEHLGVKKQMGDALLKQAAIVYQIC